MDYIKFIEKDYTLTEFCAIYSHKKTIHLYEPRFLFTYRNKFARKRSFSYYNKDYDDLDFCQKFEITYLIVQRNTETVFYDFVYESGFKNLHQNLVYQNLLEHEYSCDKVNTVSSEINIYNQYKYENREKRKNEYDIRNSPLFDIRQEIEELTLDKMNHDFYFYLNIFCQHV